MRNWPVNVENSQGAIITLQAYYIQGAFLTGPPLSCLRINSLFKLWDFTVRYVVCIFWKCSNAVINSFFRSHNVHWSLFQLEHSAFHMFGPSKGPKWSTSDMFTNKAICDHLLNGTMLEQGWNGTEVIQADQFGPFARPIIWPPKGAKRGPK